jgi:hypothetical protein
MPAFAGMTMIERLGGYGVFGANGVELMNRSFVSFAALAAVALAGPVGAAETYKFETPTPPGVSAPDTLDTRFGTLHFFGGFPDAASVRRL